MNTALANLLFGVVILGGQAFCHLCFILGYWYKNSISFTSVAALKEYVEKAAIVTLFGAFVFNLFGYAIFFYWTQVLWADIDTGDCLTGYNLFDFVNWLIILLVCLSSAIIVAFGTCCCVCCAPCIIKGVSDYLK